MVDWREALILVCLLVKKTRRKNLSATGCSDGGNGFYEAS